MTRIVCPYTPERIHPDTKALIKEVGGEFMEMTEFDSYYRLLAHLWEEGESFIIIEHDAVPVSGAIQRLADCERDWCICPFPDGSSSGLSCVCVSSNVISATPDLWSDMPLRHWRYCDAWLGAKLKKLFDQHYHEHLLAHNHVDTSIIPASSLIMRTRRDTDSELEVAFYDPEIEFEFAAVTLDKTSPAYSTVSSRQEFLNQQLVSLQSRSNNEWL